MIGTGLVERETHPNQSFKSNAVPFNGFYAVVPRESTISVHNKGDMFGDRSLAQDAYQEFADLGDGPLDWRGLKKPTPRL